MFTHLSFNNPFHLYKIKGDKIIRDDYKFSFLAPEYQKAEYVKLPNLTKDEIYALIMELRKDERFRDMCIALYFNTRPYNGSIEKMYKIRKGNKTENVKDLLKIIKRNELLLP